MMTAMRSLGSAFAILVAATAPAQADAACSALCAQIAPAINGTVTPGAALPLPADAVLARIAAAVPATAAGAPTLFAVKHAWPEDDDAQARLVRVPVGDAAARQVVLVASVDGQIRGGAVVDKDGKPVAACNAFMAQFTGKNVPPLDGAVARTAVSKRLAELEAGDAGGKTTAAFVDVRRQMAAQAVPAGAILQALEAGRAPADGEVAAMRAAYQALRARTSDLAPMLGKSGADYTRLVAAVLAHLDDIAKAGDEKQRMALHKKLKGDCRDCHELQSDKFDGGFEEFAVGERLRLGLGMQPFLVGYDVVAGGLADKDAQALADACYRAALLLEASRK